MPRKKLVNLCAVIVGTLVLLAAVGNKNEAAKVLEDSYQLSRDLPTQDRAFFLVRLTDISTSITPQRTEEWCQELLEIAPKLPADWNRVATEKNGLVPLSRVNPIRAFDLLSQVEKPIPHDEGLTEDVRADAAAIIFVSYFHVTGAAGIDGIIKMADVIGEPGGEYPYRAMGRILEELAKIHTDSKATDIFNQALSHYKRGSDFQDENEQFYEFLISAHSIIPDSTYKAGLQEFVDHLESSKSKEPLRFSAEVRTDSGTYPFDSQKKLLLFRIFPTIAKIDKSWAQELIRENSVLSNADTEIRSISAAASTGEPTPTNEAAVRDKINEKVASRKVEYLQESDPVAALSDARYLSGPERAKAFAAVMPSLAQINQSQAKDAFDELKLFSDKLPEGRSRLRGLVATAKAAYYLNDFNGFSDYTAQAFDYGIRLYKKDTTSKQDNITLRHAGAPELIELADFTGEHMGDRVLSRVNSVKDNGLRAFLLLYAAKGIGAAETNKIFATK